MKSRNSYFLVCKECGRRKPAFIVVREHDLIKPETIPSSKELPPLVGRFKCSVCGSKEIEIEAKQRVLDRQSMWRQPKMLAVFSTSQAAVG